MITIRDNPPIVTTVIKVQHRIPLGSKFKAVHGTRVGTVLAIFAGPMGLCYRVAYDDAPTEMHDWEVNQAEVRWAWWSE